MRRLALGLLLSAICAASGASAQSPEPSAAENAPAPIPVFSRADVVRLATEQNPTIAAARADIAMRQAQKGQAEAARWPEVTLDFGVGPSITAKRVPGTAVASTQNAYSDVTFDDFTVTLGSHLRAIQPLYTFGKIGHRLRAAEHGILAAEAQVRMTRADVVVEALRLYETHLFARDTQLFLEEVLHTLQKSIESTQEQLDDDSPDVSEIDLLRLESAVAVAESGLAQARAGVAQTAAGLRAYLGLASTTQWTPADAHLTPGSPVQSPLEELVRSALDKRPELQALTEGIEAFRQLAEAEHADYWPNFFAMIDVSAAYTPGRDLVDTRYVVDPLYHFVPAILVGMRWSFQADTPGRRADEMRAEVLRLTELQRWASLGIPTEVEVAYQSARAARDGLAAVERGLKKAKKWVVRASADYSAGFSDSRALTDAVQAYSLLRLEKLDTLLRLNVALAELHQATGTLEPGAFAAADAESAGGE